MSVGILTTTKFLKQRSVKEGRRIVSEFLFKIHAFGKENAGGREFSLKTEGTEISHTKPAYVI